MTDTSTVWDAVNNRGDWKLTGSVLQTGDDLATAALISAFTDRVANPDDAIPDGSTDPRGWWGDEGQDFPIGSLMWLLYRRKQDPQTLIDANTYLTAAYAWMISDGVIASVDIQASYPRPGMLGAQQVFYKPDGTKIPLNFAWVWDQFDQAN